MSDEESFVILGSSPMSSLENDGIEVSKIDSEVSLSNSDNSGSRFASLGSSQLVDIKDAQENVGIQLVPQMEIPVSIKSTYMQKSSNKITDSLKETVQNSDYRISDRDIAASKLWSRQPVVEVEENMMPLSLEDCALKSPLEQNSKESNKNMRSSVYEQQSFNKTSPLNCADRNLAASFLMGEVNSDVLKTSVYSQFPSISMEACAEDVLKLQNLVTEYSDLKATIKKANNTMKLFYNNSLQWKEKMKTMEEQHKQQLQLFQIEIEELRIRNMKMEDSFRCQIEALEIARKKDREENIQEISEKNALLENMRAQIEKMEQQQLNSFEFVLQNQDEKQTEHFNKFFITHREHELQIKNLQRQLSEILASNLDLKDIEKQYIDELNCLKVNLVSAEELIKKNTHEITQLTALNKEKDKQIETLEKSLKSLQIAFEEQKERVSLLETQNELHRSDFEMEKQSHETVAKEKIQILQDLRALQKRNQELIEEHQKLADNFQRRLSTAAANKGTLIAAASAAQNYFNNPQRPIRVLPSPSASVATPPTATHMCPVCNKAFKALHKLVDHVNDCVDKC